MIVEILLVASTLIGATCHQYDGKCNDCVQAKLSEFHILPKECIYAGFVSRGEKNVTTGRCYKWGGKTHRLHSREKGWIRTPEQCASLASGGPIKETREPVKGEPIITTGCYPAGASSSAPRKAIPGCFVALIDSTRTRAWTSMDQADARCSKEHPHTLRTLDRWAELVLKKSGSSEVVIVNSNFFYAPARGFNPYATKCTTVHGLLCSNGKLINDKIEPGHKEDIADSEANTTHSLAIAKDGTAQILKPKATMTTCKDYQAIVSGYRLLDSGRIVDLSAKDPGEKTPAKDPRLRWYHFVEHDEALPRTVVGIRVDGKLVMVAANNGKRSNNLTVLGAAKLLQELGVVDAIMLDGGGSSYLLHLKKGKKVQSTLASDFAQYREKDKPVIEEHLSGCEQKKACRPSSPLPCTAGLRCHRPVPAFFAFTPLGLTPKQK